MQKVSTLSAFRNYGTRQPETKRQLIFCDDLHIASFKKFHKEPITY